MKDLVLVHPLPSEPMFSAITEEVRRRLNAGVIVYLLSDTYGFSHENNDKIIEIPSYIDPRTFKHELLEGRTYITSGGHYHPQFFGLKWDLFVRKVKGVDICGQARNVCVKSVYELLVGKIEEDSKDFRIYKSASKFLGMDSKDFKQCISYSISCKVLENLCI